MLRFLNTFNDHSVKQYSPKKFAEKIELLQDKNKLKGHEHKCNQSH